MNNDEQILQGNIQFGPALKAAFDPAELDKCQITAGKDERLEAGRIINLLRPKPLDQPMSFRSFLRLKKEVLEAYEAWLRVATNNYMESEKAVPWPEALKGLTQEDIEILKL